MSPINNVNMCLCGLYGSNPPELLCNKQKDKSHVLLRLCGTNGKLKDLPPAPRVHTQGSPPRSHRLCLSPAQDDSSMSSEDMNGVEPTWVAAEPPPVPEPSPPNGERVSDPAPLKEEDGKTWLSVLISYCLLMARWLFRCFNSCFVFIYIWNLNVYALHEKGHRLRMHRKQLALFLVD